MKILNTPLRLLTVDEMRVLHQRTVDLLESTGLLIEHDGFLDALEAHGANIDRQRKVAKFPSSLTEQAVQAMSVSPCVIKDEEQTVIASVEAEISEFLQRPLSFAFGGSALEVISEDGLSNRPARFEDLDRLVRFGNGHPRIKYVGGPPVLMSYDEQNKPIPPQLRELAGMAYMAKHSTKLGTHCPTNAIEVAFAVELSELLTGSTQDKLDSPAFLAPFLGPRCSDSPLRISAKPAETLYELAIRGLPVILAPMPLAGATSPVTPASAVLIANAEILGLITALWAVGSHSKHNHVALTGILDMRTTAASFSSPNTLIQDIALTQLQKYMYGLDCMCPTDYIDAKYPGFQSGMERALKIALIAASGHTYPSIGQLKSGLVCSPEQACLDIEAFDWMHHFMRGIEISEETLCFDLIQQQGIGGNFIENDHTYHHFKEEFFFPKLSDRDAQDCRDMVQAAAQEVNTILARTPTFHRDPVICAEIDRLFEYTVRRLSGE